jgi:hypothetical protein
VGVVADADLDRDAIDVPRSTGGWPAALASARLWPIPNVPRERNLSGVSFAVANVTSFWRGRLSARRSVPCGRARRLRESLATKLGFALSSSPMVARTR